MSIYNSNFNQNSVLDIIFKLCHKQPFRLFYFCFLPKKIRIKIAYHVSKKKTFFVAYAANEFIKQYEQGLLTKYQLKPKRLFSDNKIIWQYWGQGFDSKFPDIVNLCFNSVDKYKGDYQVIRLHDGNIHEYLDLPEFVWHKRQKKSFKPAFFADLLRLALLDVYGGVWIDATILLTDKIPNDILDQEFFAFQRDANSKNKEYFYKFNPEYFNWNQDHYVNLLNSFIVSKQNNTLIHTMLDLILNYWDKENEICYYFFFQIIFDRLVNLPQYQQYNCEIKDDTIPHLLIQNINKPFDEAEYQNIIKQTSIHKLTYKKREKKSDRTYYDFLWDAFCSK